MRHSLVPLLSAAAIAFGFAFAGSTAAKAESVMAECASQWKQAQAAGTTAGETWPQFLSQCRTRASAAPAPSSATFAPAPLLPRRPRRPVSQDPSSHGGSRRLRPPRRRPTMGRQRPLGRANTRRSCRRAPAAHRTPLCGSILHRAFTTTLGPTTTGIPSEAPICAKPTRGRQGIAQRAKSPRPIPDKKGRGRRIMSA